ncbi:MAG: DUF1593 domain-containing protein [Gammaproteobacteria bacterium]|nr:DUF1593 domain-containing protein [Gammaproteobacteria bacterium]
MQIITHISRQLRYLALIVLACPAIAIAQQLASDEPSPLLERPRIVVTTDPELDDLNSLVRFLLYSTDFRIEGLIYASSQFHWKGDGKGTLWFVEGREYTRFGLKMGPMASWRWPEGEGHIDQVVDAYEASYQNLRVHDARYPTPEYLRSIIRDGNIEFDGVFAKDTPGSELIKSLMLDDVPGPLYITAWGGQSTIARALKSIQDEFEGTPEWTSLKAKISAKVILLVSGDQDDTEAKYIRPMWPDLYPRGRLYAGMNLSYGAQTRASAANAAYYGAQWMAEHVSGKGALGAVYRVWGDGKGLVANDIFDYFGLAGYSDDELKQKGYIVWTPVQPKGSWLGEGDTFTFLNALDFGLRSLEDENYGGVGGYRRMPIAGESEPGFLGDGVNQNGEAGGPEYPDFFKVVQNDFAARLTWAAVAKFEEANHPPQVSLLGPRDIVAAPGATVRLTASASDPDDDAVTMKWWQFEAVDSYPGKVSFADTGSSSTLVQVPTDAEAGQTLHIVIEASDDAPLPLTRYQRVIITVAATRGRGVAN